MYSITSTYTLPVNQPITLFLRPTRSRVEQYQSVMERLQGILEKFQEWNDELSLRLREWGLEVSRISLEEMVQPRQAEEVDRQIQRLANDILVNPFKSGISGLSKPEMLKEPVLDRDHVWEKWMLDEYLEICSDSPYDNQPIEARSHEFAKAMIDWLDSFTCKEIPTENYFGPSSTTALTVHSSNSNSNTSLSLSSLRSLSAPSAMILRPKIGWPIGPNEPNREALLKRRLIEYVDLAHKAFQIKECRRKQKENEQQLIVWEQMNLELRRNIELRIEEARKAAAEHERVINGRIDSMENNFKAEIRNQQLSHEAHSRQMQTSIQEANNKSAQLQEQVQHQEHRIHHIVAENQNLYQEVLRLRDEARDSGSSCTIL
ncbi:MAG: hypothetical protein K0S74_1144 [Chlamydiales bacterium]|jgi:hypothetical protein|nr:hypothetical protein [Chlamydiales bacterium]